jgi:hypothetical protein
MHRCPTSVLVADDYLLFNDNPFAPPPHHDLDYIGDINTSKAYIESYRKYITNPSKQVLLPVIFYIDGAAAGQFADLPVTPLRIYNGKNFVMVRLHNAPCCTRQGISSTPKYFLTFLTTQRITTHTKRLLNSVKKKSLMRYILAEVLLLAAQNFKESLEACQNVKLGAILN